MTEAKKLFARLDKAILNCFTVPNEKLPERFHNKKEGRVSLAKLARRADKRDGLTEHKKEKMIKAENIKRLAAQVPADGQLTQGFDYSQNETNDLAQYRAECALVDAMIKGGVIEADELREDDAIEFGNSVFYKGK